LAALIQRLKGPGRAAGLGWPAILLVAVVVLAAVTLVVVLGYDVLGAGGALMSLTHRVLVRFGPIGALLLLYSEESGIPVPVPGDVYVAYLGHLANSPLMWFFAWLGIIAAVLGGSTNLYLISGRWGRSLVRGRIGRLIHLSPRRLATAERWFSRWGALAIIFGRHIPGFRIPITVAVGIFGVPYRTFVFGVTVSTAVWAGFWLWVGAHFGARIGHFLGGHRWAYWVVGLVIVALIAAAITRMVLTEEPSPADE
jgi:membrane protein DedA with SNARE-associated domain